MTAAQHKVLLIDDSEISLHFVAGVLLRAGYDVRNLQSISTISNEPYLAVVLRGSF